MRGDVFWWAAIALLLFAAEILAPGAFASSSSPHTLSLIHI